MHALLAWIPCNPPPVAGRPAHARTGTGLHCTNGGRWLLAWIGRDEPKPPEKRWRGPGWKRSGASRAARAFTFSPAGGDGHGRTARIGRHGGGAHMGARRPELWMPAVGVSWGRLQAGCASACREPAASQAGLNFGFGSDLSLSGLVRNLLSVTRSLASGYRSIDLVV